MKERIFRETPFAWVGKNVTRIIRKKFKGRILTTKLAVYWAICEMDSDFKNEPISKGVIEAICGYCGVYQDTVRNIITEFEKLGLCKREYIIGDDGRYLGMNLYLCSPVMVKTSTGLQPKTLKKIDKDKKIDIYKNNKNIKLTELLYFLVKKNYPFIKDKDRTKDYAELNKLNRLDNYTYEQIEFIIRWSQQDEFWKQNIRSVSSLRKQFEQLVVKAKGEYDTRKVVNFDQ